MTILAPSTYQTHFRQLRQQWKQWHPRPTPLQTANKTELITLSHITAHGLKIWATAFTDQHLPQLTTTHLSSRGANRQPLSHHWHLTTPWKTYIPFNNPYLPTGPKRNWNSRFPARAVASPWKHKSPVYGRIFSSASERHLYWHFFLDTLTGFLHISASSTTSCIPDALWKCGPRLICRYINHLHGVDNHQEPCESLLKLVSFVWYHLSEP